MIELRGITWDHTRGYLPMVATAQRFSELNPRIGISWEKRALQRFADWQIEQLADHFDLLVIDHQQIEVIGELFDLPIGESLQSALLPGNADPRIEFREPL